MAVLHILLSIFIVTISRSITEVDSLPPTDIYWNRTSSIFHTSNNDHIIQVRIGQSIRFMCPYYPEGSAADMEHYTIYMVPKQHYDQCSLPSMDQGHLFNLGIVMVHNCSAPTTNNNYLLPIVKFSSLPPSLGGLVFEEGASYYFTSISTGSLSGIHNTESSSSACKRFHMKTQLRVCCNQNSSQSCEPGVVLCSTLDSSNESTMSPDPHWTIQPDRSTRSRPTNPPTTPPTTTTVKPTSTIKQIITSTVKGSNQGSTEPRIGSRAAHITGSLLTLCICSIFSMVFHSR